MEALRRARDGEAGPLWIRADVQTQGRGRQGREWISEAGNLYTSLLLIHEGEVAAASGLGFVAALALADTVLDLAPDASVSLKWPNDVLLNKSKLSGILIDTEMRGRGLVVVVGMGLNLANAPAVTRFPATSLMAEGIHTSIDMAFGYLVANFAKRLGQWDGGRGFVLLRADWLSRAHALGEVISLDLAGETITGRFSDLAADGALVLTLADGSTRILHAGDVRSTRQSGSHAFPGVHS